MCSLKIKKNKKREEVGRKLSGVGLSGLNSTKVYFVLTEQATNTTGAAAPRQLVASIGNRKFFFCGCDEKRVL